MRTYVRALALAGLVFFSAISFAEHPSLAQSDAGQSTAGTLESPIGKIMTATGAVTVERAAIVAVQAKLTSGPIPAKVGDFVYRGDVVLTGRDGKIGIVFTDGTAFNLSANGRMVLNEYIYDPKGNSNSTLLSLTQGSLTFVAGAVARTGDMKVDTPVATMGIRGTTPHVEISENGVVTFATLMEETRIAPSEPRGGQQDIQPATPDRRRAAGGTSDPNRLSPQEAAKYNRLFNMDLRICRGC